MHIQVDSARDYLEELNKAGTQSSQSAAASQRLSAFLACVGRKNDSITSSSSSDTAQQHATAPQQEQQQNYTVTVVDLELAQCIQALKPQVLEQMMTGGGSVAQWHCMRVDHLTTIPLEYITDPALLSRCAAQLSETLLNDVANIGGMLGYSIRSDTNCAESAAIICSLLNAGFAYVTSETGKLMALLPMQRSMLVLNDPGNYVSDKGGKPSENEVNCSKIGGRSGDGGSLGCGGRWVNSADNKECEYERGYVPFRLPATLRKRAKDFARVFRNNVKQKLSLRLNSNFELSLARLREHHGGDCWIGAALESVWRRMLSAPTAPPQLLVFELWYGDDMIAADFAHPTNNGSSVYVATRFFDRSKAVRNLIPGFLLALVECAVLRAHGCCIWDLGTANLCPLMLYKLDLTGEPYTRPEAMYELTRAKVAFANDKCTSSAEENAQIKSKSTVNRMKDLRPGVLIENITISDLLSDE